MRITPSGILSDQDIEREIGRGIILNPFDGNLIQPASIDLRMGHRFRIFNTGKYTHIDVKQPMEDLTELLSIEKDGDDSFVLHPGDFVLGETVEYVALDNRIVARLEGKSSLARLGLLIHSTAGFFDPGFRGIPTLELHNISRLPMALYYGMKIGQMSFMYLNTPAMNPYGSEGLGSKYQNQNGPAASRYWENFQ